MEETPGGNALIEISLALAMAFFTLLVLALVAMTVPRAMDSQAELAATHINDITILASATEGEGRALSDDEQLVVYHQGLFLSPDLTPLDITQLPAAQVVILAVDESTGLQKIAELVAQFSGSVRVTPLNPQWQNRLELLP